MGADADRRERLEDLEGGGAVLEVHHHGGAGGVVRAADRLDRAGGVPVDAPVPRTRLQHAGANRRVARCAGLGRALGQVGDEGRREILGVQIEKRVVGAVVLGPVESRREHDVHARRVGDAPHGGRTSPETERSGIDHRVEPGCRELARLFASGVFVVELVARQER